MKKVYFLIFLTALVVVAIVWKISVSQKSNPDLDFFAQCLADKGATMYGAKWCAHCQNQKKEFGKSFRFINYVECPDNIELCLSRGVASYPTWILNDKKYEGEMSLEGLSEISGCALPNKK